MRWLLWFLMAFGWGIQAALLWHGNNNRAALAAATATVIFACVGWFFYRREKRLSETRGLKIKPPTI